MENNDGNVGIKYTREKRSSLLGHTEVVFNQVCNQEMTSFDIIADAEGIKFRGVSCSITSQEELESYAKVIGDAWKDHLALREGTRKKILGNA